MTDVKTTTATKITTAVEFLRHIHDKAYSPAALKKYLIEKRGLTNEEVNIALMINNNQMQQKNKDSKEVANALPNKGRSDRPIESPSNRNPVRDLSFLMASRRVEGRKMIGDFLRGEKIFCAKLECLIKLYYQDLAYYADQGKMQMKRKEVDEIFLRIHDLLKFHKRFHHDLKAGSNIAGLFLKEFKFLKGYADYVKECQNTVDKMKKYIADGRMFFYLSLTRKKSYLKDSEMVDMLLAPLERVRVYRSLLNRLFAWTDKKQAQEYEILGKAARRIGRLAAYVENYEYSIRNQNELNKVQRFLDIQFAIIVPNRTLIRYGPMIRRTSSWATKNKRYVFFLFNDLLLWTSKNGKYENCMQLCKCAVILSRSKNNPQKKFQVVSNGQITKRLRLECINQREKNEWVAKIEKTISALKKSTATGLDAVWLKFAPGHSNGHSNGIEVSDDMSELDGDLDSNFLESTEVSLQEEEDSLMIHNTREDSEPDDPYNKRFLATTNLKAQDCKEIVPIDKFLTNVSDTEPEEDEKIPGGQQKTFNDNYMKNSKGDEIHIINREQEHKRENAKSDSSFEFFDTKPKARKSNTGSIVRKSRLGKHMLVGKPSTSHLTKPSTSQITIRLDSL